jgi:hypothetical protein
VTLQTAFKLAGSGKRSPELRDWWTAASIAAPFVRNVCAHIWAAQDGWCTASPISMPRETPRRLDRIHLCYRIVQYPPGGY